MRALAFDLGSRRIGVAVSDSGGTVATPVTTVARHRSMVETHRVLAGLVEEWEAEVVVVGLPLSLDGSTGPAARNVEAEVAELSAHLDVPVVTQDERFTTVTAADRLREQGVKGPRRKDLIDRAAATVLLQSWLDARANLGRTEQ